MWSSGTDIIQAINNRWELALQPSISEEELVQALAVQINHLIIHDFPRLIHILYVIDVSEEKLKNYSEHTKTAMRESLLRSLW